MASLIQSEVVEEDAADLQFPKGSLMLYFKIFVWITLCVIYIF